MAPVKLSPPTPNLPFLSPNQQCQNTEGKISHSMDLLTASSPGGLPTLSLTINTSWLPWGRVAMLLGDGGTCALTSHIGMLKKSGSWSPPMGWHGVSLTNLPIHILSYHAKFDSPASNSIKQSARKLRMEKYLSHRAPPLASEVKVTQKNCPCPKCITIMPNMVA